MDALDFQLATHCRIYYLWRPTLKDTNDDMVLELAVSANAGVVVAFNVPDFKGSDRFGIRAIGPKEFLREIGAIE